MVTARSRRPGLLAAVAAVVALVATACTGRAPAPSPSTPGPSPTPDAVVGLRVAVVLPPPDTAGDAERARLRRALDREAVASPPPAPPTASPAAAPGVGELRLVTPDATEFVAPTVQLLAREGYDLVCVLGAGAAGVVTSIADEIPQTRLCAAPARIADPPDNVLAFDVRVEEATFLAGIAAASVSARQPGLVVGPDAWAPGRRRSGYRQGVARVDPARSVRIDGPVDTPDAVRSAVRQQLADGVRAVLDATATADAVVLETVREAAGGAGQPPVMIGGTAALRDPPTAAGQVSGRVLMTVTVRLEEAVRRAVAAASGSWEARTVELGLAEGALEVLAGPGDRAAEISRRLERVRARIATGDLRVLPRGG